MIVQPVFLIKTPGRLSEPRSTPVPLLRPDQRAADRHAAAWRSIPTHPDRADLWAWIFIEARPCLLPLSGSGQCDSSWRGRQPTPSLRRGCRAASPRRRPRVAVGRGPTRSVPGNDRRSPTGRRGERDRHMPEHTCRAKRGAFSRMHGVRSGWHARVEQGDAGGDVGRWQRHSVHWAVADGRRDEARGVLRTYWLRRHTRPPGGCSRRDDRP